MDETNESEGKATAEISERCHAGPHRRTKDRAVRKVQETQSWRTFALSATTGTEWPLMFNFDPTPFGDLLKIEGDRIYYLKALRTGTPKSYLWADPEEKVRAWFYTKLVTELGYPAERIDLEVVVGRRSPVDFADIVVYRDDALTERFLVVECKAPDENFEQAISQAWGNANNLGAQFACTTDGTQTVCFDPRTFHPGDPERRFVGLPERYGEPIVFERVKGDAVRDLRPATQSELNAKFRACHDMLWAGGRRNPAEAFDEMTKLIFCKLQDERHGTADGEPYRFQVGSNETFSEVAGRVKTIWDDFRAVAQPVFGRAITVPDDLIYRVVQSLENLSLSLAVTWTRRARHLRCFCQPSFGGRWDSFSHLVRWCASWLTSCNRAAATK